MNMISALYRYQKSERRAVAQAWARRSNAVQAEARMTREPDADTLRRRALHDARGTVLREGCTYSATGEQRWQVVRSVHGRTDQRDITINGQLFKTCGPRHLPAWLR